MLSTGANPRLISFILGGLQSKASGSGRSICLLTKRWQTRPYKQKSKSFWRRSDKSELKIKSLGHDSNIGVDTCHSHRMNVAAEKAQDIALKSPQLSHFQPHLGKKIRMFASKPSDSLSKGVHKFMWNFHFFSKFLGNQ